MNLTLTNPSKAYTSKERITYIFLPFSIGHVPIQAAELVIPQITVVHQNIQHLSHL